MTRLILNDQLIETDLPKGMTLLDFIRYERRLPGTKIGCREGDCGACTALVGVLKGDEIVYRSVTSCITPLGNVHGKHVVTIEGLNMTQLSPVQQAMVNESGTQCGFCTPGFVVSLSGYCLSNEEVSIDKAISAIDGNICRCTGYKSIERAAQSIVELLNKKDTVHPVRWAVENGFVPAYFSSMAERIKMIPAQPDGGQQVVGGGTDLYVQRHDSMHHADIRFVSDRADLKGTRVKDGVCTIGASSNVTDLLESADLRAMFPSLGRHLKLVSSTPIRNMGTLAGNFVNASPIGDLTCFFLALNSSITLQNKAGSSRQILLRDFYKGYKILDKTEDEYITTVSFEIPDQLSLFNFEKVSKRTYLDIASVNSAIHIKTDGQTILDIHASAGGVGPTPLYLTQTCAFLKGRSLTEHTIQEGLEYVQKDIRPIGDVRGSEEYKRLLMRQLFYSHFMELFPEKFRLEVFL